jgi:hypothetical protein
MAIFDEERQVRQLSRQLHEEMSRLEPPRDLAATVRRRHNRLVWAMRMGVAVPAAAAVAVVAVATLGSPAARQHNGAPSRTDSTVVLTAANVSTRTSEALGKLDDYIQSAHEVRSDAQVTDHREDAKTKRRRSDDYDAHGAHLTSLSMTGDNDSNALVVDYVSHTWYRTGFGIAKASPGPEKPGWLDLPLVDPDYVKKAEASGTLRLIGPETVGGHNTVHLQWAIEGFTLDLWVDASTYLPFRQVTHGAKGGSTVDYTWLPRTPENLAGLDLAIPAGFSQGKPEDPKHK